MASPLYVAQNGTYDEFLEVYGPEAHDATEQQRQRFTSGRELINAAKARREKVKRLKPSPKTSKTSLRTG